MHTRRIRHRSFASRWLLPSLLAALIGLPEPASAWPSPAASPNAGAAAFSADDGGKKSGKKRSRKRRRSSRKTKASSKVIRWGQRPGESNKKYDRRYRRALAKTKLDKEGSIDGGPARLWTYMGHPFIVRSDIDADFTVKTLMYMEMLHREYGAAYKKLLGAVPGTAKEPIEVIVFKDRETYMANGGSPGSGGQFMTHFSFPDRGPHWPAPHYRLMLFTDGTGDFARWSKSTLKHEAAHMEMRLRLGMVLHPSGVAIPVDCPRWFDEGQASVFEYWDFDKSVDENFKLIPKRGRYAPTIRRIHDTDRWKEFHYVWTIDPQTWHADMTSIQGFLNYAQAWSLAAYMMHGGVKGRKDFRKIFNLSTRVGADRQTNWKGDGLRAWELAFPAADRDDMEENWNQWVAKYIPRDQRVPDEEWYLRRMGFNPDVLDKLAPYTEEEFEKIRDEIAKEREKREKSRKIEK